MAKPPATTIRLTVAKVGERRYELRDDRGMALDTVDTRLAALDLINALKRECKPGWRIEVSWLNCEPP
jgi:hypothetical protein